MRVSVIIRTLNEERYLGDLLESIQRQNLDYFEVETIVVDSGSTDKTLAIAGIHGCRVIHISKSEFSFGRSLNIGCDAARGDILLIVSGHCIPTSKDWLRTICAPLEEGIVEYAYGRQIGGNGSYFSEKETFNAYYPNVSRIPQQGFFCNNANSAILRKTWEKYRFDEDLTGLEDMELAQRLYRDGGKIGYVAEACVVHHHSELWRQVKRRYEREAIALRLIMPHIHIRIRDLIRYILRSTANDWKKARNQKVLIKEMFDIVRYRTCQYFGSYLGNKEHRIISDAEKDKYFYPDHSRHIEEEENGIKKYENHRVAANEGEQ